MPVKKKETTKTEEKIAVTGKKTAVKKETKHASVSVNLFDTKGKVVGEVSLPKEMFGDEFNKQLLAQAVRVYLANQRKGTASTKTRGEVAISTRKIYRQKGTGRARHGAKSAPIFVGGGIAFGPRPRDYSLQLPKKMKKRALASALSLKTQEKKIFVVKDLEKIEPKTKHMVHLLETIVGSGSKKPNRVLLVTGSDSSLVRRAASNIEGVTIEPANIITTYQVIHTGAIVFMQSALNYFEGKQE